MSYKLNRFTGELDRVGGTVSGAAVAALHVIGESPTPTPNGVATVFTVANPYVAGTLKVTRGSLRLHPTVDFSETTSTTFTVVSPPASDEPLIVDYIKA